MQKQSKYEAVIGLEVHAQLSTVSKLFSADATSFDAAPNTQTSPISLAHPGTLPVMNEAVLALAIKLGLALNCEISPNTYFARKNYFYPDLPKGYQVSQDLAPICRGGFLEINQETETAKKLLLNRIHIEEDAGKSLHDISSTNTCLDYNRAGVPLLEIVTEPCIHSAEDAFTFITELRNLVRWIGVCDGNMEEGSMRCDANISIRPVGDKNLYTRVEVKNLNSIRNVRRAIELEVARLISLTEAGEKIVQETRSYNADDHTSFSLRSKEDAHDYRYFPEPDLPLFKITESYIKKLQDAMPALPNEVRQKLVSNFQLSAYDAAAITANKETTDYFFALAERQKNFKSVANWISGPLKNYCVENSVELNQIPISLEQISALIEFTNSGQVHFNVASTKILEALMQQPSKSILAIATELNLLQQRNEDVLEDWARQVLSANPDKVVAYKKGKKALLGMFAGEVKKLSKGKADMQATQQLLSKLLSE
jgi:aspartyl-tRNA(Asn)/glutamyl-tRNA(Gln) amidotransferase subunit B